MWLRCQNKLEIVKCLNEEELEKLKEERDPYDAPSNPYCTPNPGKPGKLLWISGLNYNFA